MRPLVRAARVIGALGLCVWLLAWLFLDRWPAFGARPDTGGPRSFASSPQWHDGRFRNPQPMWNDLRSGLLGFVRPAKAQASPAEGEVPTMQPDWSHAPASGLRVTWFGHASALIEIDGRRVLVDPIWSARASPFAAIGPERWFAPPVALDALPTPDVVLVSHDHYDHLDMATVQALARRVRWFVVPLGVGAHLERWGVEHARIVELDWWQATRAVDGLTITATPARHASGRVDPQSMHALWAGFAVRGSRHAFWYSGDTGTHAELAAIGQRLGPFDLTLVENGQYDAAWPDWHIGPEFAVEAHRLVRGRWLLPVHWALFKLAHHGWTEPGERVLAAARCQRVALLLPRPGESIEPASAGAPRRWWPERSWASAEQAPIRPTTDGHDEHRRAQPACVDAG